MQQTFSTPQTPVASTMIENCVFCGISFQSKTDHTECLKKEDIDEITEAQRYSPFELNEVDGNQIKFEVEEEELTEPQVVRFFPPASSEVIVKPEIKIEQKVISIEIW